MSSNDFITILIAIVSVDWLAAGAILGFHRCVLISVMLREKQCFQYHQLPNKPVCMSYIPWKNVAYLSLIVTTIIKISGKHV